MNHCWSTRFGVLLDTLTPESPGTIIPVYCQYLSSSYFYEEIKVWTCLLRTICLKKSWIASTAIVDIREYRKLTIRTNLHRDRNICTRTPE